ncbi:CRISPR-associated protein Cas4 [Thermodesulfitimonas autotrophica]|uniref:CRISPR-associated protein Cas4 n=1 Tax=Thermodesulfitimonas autotrophica TaxID=1894989 RepID=UPI002FE0E13D
MTEKELPDVESAASTGLQVIGSFIQAYMVCPRQAWLMSRQICPDEDHIYLQLGRFIQRQSYSRERKEIHLGHLALDLVRRDGQNLVIAEVKKSSRAANAARMQLAFYLYELRQMGLEAQGELLFPEERRRERLVLDESLAAEVAALKQRIQTLLRQPAPPPPARIQFCTRCAYSDFCWA